jgi:hypothetical protein
MFCALNDAETRYLVVGAYAVLHYGEPRYTKDLDIWVDPEPANAARAWRALAVFGAPLTELAPSDLAQKGIIFQIGVQPNRIDIITSIQGVEFADAWATRTDDTYGGVPIHLLSLDDLIRNKSLVGRPQDLIDVEQLERVRKHRSSR